MDTAIEWTGQKAQLLQETLGHTIRQFAGHLGVNPRTVTKWRKHGALRRCNDEMQEVLSQALGLAPAEKREAFYDALAALASELSQAEGPSSPFTVISHKFIPAYVGPPLTAAFDRAKPHPEGPGGLEQRVVPIQHPTGAAAAAHLLACGVAVVHLEEELTFDGITKLALWRYRTYPTDRTWAGSHLSDLFGTTDGIEVPQYVLSLYELRDHGWSLDSLPTALHLITTPSVLVNRRDPDAIEPVSPQAESEKFCAGWTHPDVIPFHGGSSLGLAGWSGVTYFPHPHEHALSIRELVALEVDVQGLWALSSQILAAIEDGQDPVMPDQYGWRYLRGAYSRLRASRPDETAQHRAMREAILATSDLPDRLRDAQEALRDARV